MKQKDFLIHIHVYYTGMWPELRGYLSSLPEGTDYDLWVTYVKNDSKFLQDVRTTAPTAHILKVENKGYDIGPFVEVLRRIEVDDYKYIIKLHSKRDVKGLVYPHIGLTEVSGDKWRHYLLSFMSGENFGKCLAAFEQNPRLGMVGHHALICRKELADDRAWQESMKWIADYGLQVSEPSYVAGSMFICRSRLMKLVKEVLSQESFERPVHEHSSTISHSVERFLGHAVAAQGMLIEDVYTSKADKVRLVLIGVLQRCLYLTCRFFYQKKITSNGRLIVKICKIPVCFKRCR